MKIIEKDLSEIRPYENNPRHNEVAVGFVANSLREFGWKQPIVIDKDGVIVAGHTRYKAALSLGWTKAPCLIADDLSDEQIRAYRLADNKTGEMAEWDFDALEQELDALTMDMSLFGFLDEGEEQPEVQEDEFDEKPQDEPKAKRGQIYQLGRHRLMCGDSTIAEDVERLMDGEKADMVFTDPPYGVSYTDKNEFLNSIDKPICVANAIENDNKKPEEMHDFWVSAFTNLHRFTADRMSYYITAPQGGDLLLLLLEAVRECGFALKHQLIWNKNNHVLGRCDYNYKHEPIIYGWKIGGTHKFVGGGSMLTSVWDVPKPLRSDLHPTMKPIELIANAVLNSTDKDEIVLDLFGGSGSTLMACEQTGRVCRMMEYEPHYIDVIINRWEQFTGGKAVLLNV